MSRKKRLRVLAVTNNKRSALLPDIPTISEAGLKGYESEGWHGLFTPAGTPRPAIDRLFKEISTLLRDPKINTLLAAGGAEPVGMPPDEFGKALHREIDEVGQGRQGLRHEDGLKAGINIQAVI